MLQSHCTKDHYFFALYVQVVFIALLFICLNDITSFVTSCPTWLGLRFFIIISNIGLFRTMFKYSVWISIFGLIYFFGWVCVYLYRLVISTWTLLQQIHNENFLFLMMPKNRLTSLITVTYEFFWKRMLVQGIFFSKFSYLSKYSRK